VDECKPLLEGLTATLQRPRRVAALPPRNSSAQAQLANQPNDPGHTTAARLDTHSGKVVLESKHWTDVESTNRVCTSV